jgi:hypothetical protein
MPPQNDVKFNNQGYVTSYITEIIELITPKYDNILTLDTTDKSLPETIALLTGKTDIKLPSLKTYQYSSLIPKIRLFRVNSQDDSEYEFLFNKDYKYNVLSDIHIVGNNCGIKSINWILAGTNPASAEKTIEVKIEFYFDSINSFSGGSYDEMLNFWNSTSPNLLNSDFDFPNSKQTRNYWSLIYHPNTLPDVYSSPLFRIKAVVGWENIRPEIIKELFKGKEDINEEFFDSDLVMYLNLVQHNFAFNEDGSIKLKLRKSKTDTHGMGKNLYLSIEAQDALKEWIIKSKISSGKIFRAITVPGKIKDSLHPSHVGRIYKKIAQLSMVDQSIIKNISGHSMRVGAAQDLMLSNASFPIIMHRGRWSKIDTVMRYIEFN